MSSTATILISRSVALLSGLLLSRLAKLVRLPAITAYLAKDNDLHTSIINALDYVYEGIENGNHGTLIAKLR